MNKESIFNSPRVLFFVRCSFFNVSKISNEQSSSSSSNDYLFFTFGKFVPRLFKWRPRSRQISEGKRNALHGWLPHKGLIKALMIYIRISLLRRGLFVLWGGFCIEALYCGEAFVLRLGRKKKRARGGRPPRAFYFFRYFDGDTQREPLRRREHKNEKVSCSAFQGKTAWAMISVWWSGDRIWK